MRSLDLVARTCAVESGVDLAHGRGEDLWPRAGSARRDETLPWSRVPDGRAEFVEGFLLSQDLRPARDVSPDLTPTSRNRSRLNIRSG